MNVVEELEQLITDEMLAARILNGDSAAFEELVNRYKNSIFHVVYRLVGQYQEAEDISQEVFILIYEKMYQFDRKKKQPLDTPYCSKYCH